MTEIKPKIVDGEPMCDSKNCAVDGFSDNGTPETAWCQCCDDADPCIPSLRQQRDELKKENAELKERLEKINTYATEGYTTANNEIHVEKLAQNVVKEAHWKGEHAAYRCVLAELKRLDGGE